MTLKAIVAALGGDLYAGGARASIPAPGHSASDRSISLLLSQGRVVVHGFGACDWRTARAHLRAAGLIDLQDRPVGASTLSARGAMSGAPGGRPDRGVRIATARKLWEEAVPLAPSSLSMRHLERRAIRTDLGRLDALRHHPAAPLAAYRPAGGCAPALVAAIHDPTGALTAVELVYLTASGRRDDRLRTPRKSVGVLPPGSAVRLFPAASDLLVGEGIMTVLSAAERFGRPAWALRSARNLAAWTPPPVVRRLLIAGDRGAPGESAARELQGRMHRLGVAASVVLPPEAFEDWNAAAVAQGREEGR